MRALGATAARFRSRGRIRCTDRPTREATEGLDDLGELAGADGRQRYAQEAAGALLVGVRVLLAPGDLALLRIDGGDEGVARAEHVLLHAAERLSGFDEAFVDAASREPDHVV